MALSDSEKIRLIEDHCRSFWEGDLEDFDRQLSPGFIDTDAAPGFRTGVEEAKAWARACRRESPTVRMLVTDALVAGDVVAVRANWSTPRAGRSMEQPPTGDRIGLEGIVVWELDAHGRIARRTGFVDDAAALAEIPGSLQSTRMREGGTS